MEREGGSDGRRVRSRERVSGQPRRRSAPSAGANIGKVKGGNEDTVAMGAVGGENAEEAFERAVVSELRAAEAVEAMEAFADREEERRRG